MSFSGFEPPRLDLETSALARTMLREDHWRVDQYVGDGPYPTHRAEKDEVDAFVANIRAVIRSGRAPDLASDLQLVLQNMFFAEEIQEASDHGELDRLVAFAALQWACDEVLTEINERSLLPAHVEDPVFRACPSLSERLDKDDLVRLTPADVADLRLRNERVLCCDGLAVFPHPYLAHRRELLAALLDLAAANELRVAIAVHPLRTCDPSEVQMRILEDYWHGIVTTPGNLDSLAAHDNGVNSFHFAPQDRVERLFHPMLGTWFNWNRRNRNDLEDPVRRLYIREVGLPYDRHGDAYASVHNPELHAERDTAKHAFTHTDGKIAVYDAETYPPSVDHPDIPPGKPTRTRKLWRVDGNIPDELWMDLVGCFFRGNDLIDEHFASVLSAFQNGPGHGFAVD